MGKVAFILDRTFDDAHLELARERLRLEGHEVLTVGARQGLEVDGRHGKRLTVDRNVDDVGPHDFDAAVVPEGVPINHLRTHERILNFLRDVYAEGKPVGVMRDGGFVLTRAETDVGRILTWPAVKRALLLDAIESLGSDQFRREELVAWERADVGAFCDALIDELGRGHVGATPARPHEPVDILDEQVVDSASGPAPEMI